jgi:hypothetical protein
MREGILSDVMSAPTANAQGASFGMGPIKATASNTTTIAISLTIIAILAMGGIGLYMLQPKMLLRGIIPQL